jgi:hypothetical protein
LLSWLKAHLPWVQVVFSIGESHAMNRSASLHNDSSCLRSAACQCMVTVL